MFTWPLDILLAFMITTPLIGWVSVRRGYRRVQGLFAIIALTATAVLLYQLQREVADKGVVVVGQLPFISTLGACLRIDMLSIFMAFVCTLIGLAAVFYSVGFMKSESGVTEYYTLLLGLIAGMIGVAFAGDLFTLFVFWELMCLTSYVLVAFQKQKWEPIEAGFKYLIMSAAGSATILLATSFLYGMTGTISFSGLAASLNNSSPDGWVYVTLTLVIVGFGIKAAIVPFHTWLPDAHAAAPAPISSILSGIMVQTGAYALFRVLLVVFGFMLPVWQLTLIVFAILTMFGGNIMAFLQDDLKRLLAFSTITQTGYIIFGLAVATPYGLTASLFHILNHAIMKGLLFLCAGAFSRETGSRSLKKLSGIRAKMPFTSIAFAVGGLAIAAIPPLNGFWGEWMIVAAGIRAEFIPFSALMLANIIFSIVYYIRAIRVVILEQPSSAIEKARESPASLLIPVLVLAGLCIIIGVYPGPFITAASLAAQAALDITGYISAML